TSVAHVQELPKTLERLYLGLLMDSTTGVAHNPGLDELTKHCPQLRVLAGLHIQAGTVLDEFPIPCMSLFSKMMGWLGGNHNPVTSVGISIEDLFLSNLSTDRDVVWAAEAAARLGGSYNRIILPSSGLTPQQVRHMVDLMAASGVRLTGGLVVSHYPSPTRNI
ncbi:unnamed protein product, partial [Meganyctiphanes norvegica]